jgi:hypothetical protein
MHVTTRVSGRWAVLLSLVSIAGCVTASGAGETGESSDCFSTRLVTGFSTPSQQTVYVRVKSSDMPW